MLMPKDWQLKTSIDAIVFDCDGTLSSIEGIDELAEQNGVGDTVKMLTAKAMGDSGINPDIYRQRLELVKPRQDQVNKLGQLYCEHIEPACREVISLLQHLGKTIFITSAGLKPAVDKLGDYLNIPSSQIFAVDIHFDEKGHYLNFDHRSLLTMHDGKRDIVKQLKRKYSSIAYIGDGMNDLMVYDLVSRFVGYGGAYYRENIESECDYYLKSKSFLPLLPLLLTQQECAQLNKDEKSLYDEGLNIIQYQKK